MGKHAIVLWAAMVFGISASAQTVSTDDLYPLKGQVTTITVEEGQQAVAGATVVVTYRPNSRTGFTEALGETNAAGQVSWTPRDAGIVTIAARKGGSDGDVIATANLSVRFGSFPGLGLLIMITAGTLLFGGAGLGFGMLIREGQMPQEPPST